MAELDPHAVNDELERDQAAINRRLHFLAQSGCDVMHLFYEDVYNEGVPLSQRFATLNRVLQFLGFSQLAELEVSERWAQLLDPDTYRWSDTETYKRIPGIDRVEALVGCDATGWLFRNFPSHEKHP